MPVLAQQRCFLHAHREAVARCPQCRQFYCRECITEHEERILCATCLRQLSSPAAQRRRLPEWITSIAPCAFGLMVAWLFFYFTGELLLMIPAAYHEGTVWVDRWFVVQ